MTTQQEFLRKAALELGLSQKDLAIRMAAPWETFRKWLMPNESGSYREMPEIAVSLLALKLRWAMTALSSIAALSEKRLSILRPLSD